MTVTETHPLIKQLREVFETDDELRQKDAAEQIGVSQRTLQYWLKTDTTPQKRYRPLLRVWLEQRRAVA